MKHTFAIVLMLACFAALATRRGHAQQPATADASAPATTRFQAVDITIDPGGTPIAAYQVEFVADAGRVKLVGIEGGDHPAFRDPPYYDPAALSRSRVIVAALSTNNDLPKGKTRLARLHLQVDGAGPAEYAAKLLVATSADEEINPRATVSVAPVPQALEGDAR
jgi:hypothetical protein